MPEEKSYYTPNKLYELKVKIKDLDYTNDTLEVMFASSLATAYQVVDITFLLDPNDVIVEEIFGGEPIKLQITLYREQDYPGPSINVELMYLNSDFQLTEKGQMTEMTMKDRTRLTITCLARKPFTTMSTLVNDVFIGQRLSDIVSSLAATVGTVVDFDSYNRNQAVIDQVCIPPTTFYKIIKEYDKTSDDMFDGYLDQRFGLFSGVPGVFCQHDNKVYIKNLTGKLRKNQTFTVYQLASTSGDSKLQEKIYEEALDGNVFYTYDTIETEYLGTSKFADLGSSINHLIKPKDSITATISQDLQTVAQNYSLLYSQRNNNLFIDSAAKRTRYYNEDTGYEKEATLFNSRFGKSLADLSHISLNIERNLPVLNLIDVGECVKFKPQTIEYQDLEGKYILFSSIINFVRGGPDWQTTANINLYRTNKKN